MLPTIIIGLVLLVLLALALRHVIRQRRSGGCGCGCSGCTKSCAHSLPPERQEKGHSDS